MRPSQDIEPHHKCHQKSWKRFKLWKLTEDIGMYALLYFPKMATANIPSHMLVFQYEVDTPPESDEVYLSSP